MFSLSRLRDVESASERDPMNNDDRRQRKKKNRENIKKQNTIKWEDRIIQSGEGKAKSGFGRIFFFFFFRPYVQSRHDYRST